MPPESTALTSGGGYGAAIFLDIKVEKIWLFGIPLCVLLSGCGLNESLNRMNMAQFRKQCVDFGFKPGTTAFSNCLMHQSAERDRYNQHIDDQYNRKQAGDRLNGQ